MNKWTLRLIGLLIALVLGLVIFDGWFTPEIPPAHYNRTSRSK